MVRKFEVGASTLPEGTEDASFVLFKDENTLENRRSRYIALSNREFEREMYKEELYWRST
jgi:hypothetical protein